MSFDDNNHWKFIKNKINYYCDNDQNEINGFELLKYFINNHKKDNNTCNINDDICYYDMSNLNISQLIFFLNNISNNLNLNNNIISTHYYKLINKLINNTNKQNYQLNI